MIPATARRASWSELLSHPDVVERAIQRSRFGLMAFHGGLEAGTLKIAQTAADAAGASLYVVEQPPALRWHVPSRAVDPDESPALAGWLQHVEVAIAIHGYGRVRRPRRILLGGHNRLLSARLAAALTVSLVDFEVVTDLADIPSELRGLHRGNPINRTRTPGVQLELPPSARGSARLPPNPVWGPGGAPARVVDALVNVICSHPPFV